MGDGAEAPFGQEHHLVFPGVGREGPAVGEDDGLSVLGTPILEVDLRSVASREVAALELAGLSGHTGSSSDQGLVNGCEDVPRGSIPPSTSGSLAPIRRSRVADPLYKRRRRVPSP